MSCVCVKVVWYHVVAHFFFFNDTATTEIYTLSLHDALPICASGCPYITDPVGDLSPVTLVFASPAVDIVAAGVQVDATTLTTVIEVDRKSTRLNSSHANISYAVFCLKKNNIRDTRSACLTTALMSRLYLS